MKKLIVTIILILTLFICSCSAGIVSRVSFTTTLNISNAIECDGADTVYFYVDTEVFDVSIDVNECNMQTGEYTKLKTVHTQKTLSTDTALKINLNLTNEVPYVSVTYTLKNGKTRQQFIYRDDREKLWLLELQ